MAGPAVLVADAPSFLDDLTPDSGLCLRRWDIDEYHRMAYPILFGPEERTELILGDVIIRGEGVPRLFTDDEYYRLSKYHVLKPDERTELIYGRIVLRMSPLGEPHSMTVMKTMEALRDVFGSRHIVRPQMALRLSNGLLPEPDLLVVAGQLENYVISPSASDALLLVEVSDTTLRYDRHTKARMYATDGIREYWLINLRQRTLEVRREPVNGEYALLTTFQESETVAPLSSPNTSVRVSDLLPLRLPSAR